MKKNLFFYKYLIIAGMVLVLMNSCIATSQAWEINTGDSDKAINEANSWWTESPGNPWNVQFSGMQANNDNKFFRAELRKTDKIVNNGKRCEIFKYCIESPREEHWYSFGIYLPTSGEEEFLRDPEGSEILAQWHNIPDPGEEWTSPPLALRIFNNDWCIERFWDANTLSTTEGMKARGQYESIKLGSYLEDKGKWTDWVFHVKWGWLPEHHTILEVYKNGELVLERNGQPNTTNDRSGVRQKLGIYKWDWAQPNYGGSIVSQRIVYFYDGSVLNNEYFQVLKKFYNQKIISSPDYWNRLIVNRYSARGEYMAILMKRMSGQSDLQSAIGYLVSTGVISNPDYWLENCTPGNEITSPFVEKFFINAGNTNLVLIE